MNKLKTSAIGKIIKLLYLDDDANGGNGALVFGFTDSTGVKMYDGGQDCCESRYMTTDDNLNDFIGSKLLAIEVREGPTVEDEWDECHEIEFLVVATTKGVFTVETHNEHNGYYGGFSIQHEEIA